MSTLTTRLALGFGAGFLSHLVFQGAFGSTLYAAHILPSLPFSLAPVPPLGVPRTVSLGVWAGLWALLYVVLEPWLTARLGRWLGGIAFGVLPLLGHWFVALPFKGAGVGGGFHAGMVPIEIGFHLIFGLGVAILYRAGATLTGRIPPRAVPQQG
ncbi:hypothetical protein [Paracraurococcus ruber]|uniref:Uncharacterized protein n=1 Tax=Paracraurococcus ruber TaxID=77675 RepID=A0ABS1CZC8_9PROT|nr:hypothetical protein [Paracraurococcus ruber]MBK1659628.1 hypothetical protein [Paracraurococcus ruber]TDG29378.1 hypothetical protein E2C05_18000 [Paracraurococcus ruber]